jgi:hypothetical protein
MITVELALIPLYTVARECDYKLTHVYTNSDYKDNPLLEKPVSEFKLDLTLDKPKTGLGPAAQ